ncbi:hypothetical protein [Rhodococcus sp. BH5]|uniref:hypothetical protein n=1 Tax=Rhodococcus sp. BH5 TaxID=2871702 RepID=UPI0022CD52F9|nr:hypothetical protein [Rhodococcus sp. BH5]MCZ9631351.1 hypothetical protein [Rhodococcus sp. BH5]
MANAGVDLVHIDLSNQLRTALQAESAARRDHRSARIAHQAASRNLEDAERAVEAVQSKIRKRVAGGAA